MTVAPCAGTKLRTAENCGLFVKVDTRTEPDFATPVDPGAGEIRVKAGAAPGGMQGVKAGENNGEGLGEGDGDAVAGEEVGFSTVAPLVPEKGVEGAAIEPELAEQEDKASEYIARNTTLLVRVCINTPSNGDRVRLRQHLAPNSRIPHDLFVQLGRQKVIVPLALLSWVHDHERPSVIAIGPQSGSRTTNAIASSTSGRPGATADFRGMAPGPSWAWSDGPEHAQPQMCAA